MLKRLNVVGIYVHESDKIGGCVCNGCLHLEVLESRKHYRTVEKYYCKSCQHGYFNPRKVDACGKFISSTSGITRPGRFNGGAI